MRPQTDHGQECCKLFSSYAFEYFFLFLSLPHTPLPHRLCPHPFHHFSLARCTDSRNRSTVEKFLARKKNSRRFLCDVMICRLAKRVSPFFTCHSLTFHFFEKVPCAMRIVCGWERAGWFFAMKRRTDSCECHRVTKGLKKIKKLSNEVE
jgi:hypothetical protein